MEFSRQEYRSRLPFPSPVAFPHPAVETGSPTLQADSLASEPPGKPGYNVICLEKQSNFLGFLLRERASR